MKTTFLSAIRLTLVCAVAFSGCYTLIVLGIAQLAPNHGKGEVLEANGRKYYAHIGQAFNGDRYFQSRPSAVNYNAAGSGGSNKGPTNPEYLKEVEARIDTFLVHNPGVQRGQIPSDLVTASGSGLDPDISITAAKVQVKRIALIRKIDEERLFELINSQVEKPLWGVFGTKRINVVKLNMALDKL